MRSTEWLFLFSFLPFLYSICLNKMRHRNWIVTALLPVFCVGIHLIFEGWRIQLMPLYLLVVFVLAATMRSNHGKLIKILSILMFVFGGLFAGWILPVAKLPDPTGKYQVGIVDRVLVDEDRGRRLMASVWYPSTQHGVEAPLTHHPDEVATGLGKIAGIPAFPFQYLRYFKLAASEVVPVAEAGSPFPVLVFSHGLVGLRLQNSSMMQELASWGYVVVALDHTDAAAVTVFPDGEARYYNLTTFGISPAEGEVTRQIMEDRVFPVWVADQRFAYDVIEKWAMADPLFAGKLDGLRIASFGHSFGGATALEVCRSDSRCRAAVNLDGGLYGKIVNEPAVRPLLLMSSADTNQRAIDKWRLMIGNANADAYWLELPHSTHYSFTITQLLSPLLVPRGFDPRAGLHTIDKYLRAFFDLQLRGMRTAVLDSATQDSDVKWLANKKSK